MLTLAFLSPGAALAQATGAAKDTRRLIFVLHSGLHTILSDRNPNRVSATIARLLTKHGVPERDVIQLDNPFPVASWNKMFPRESLDIFLGSMHPGSQVSRTAYLKLHRALVDHDVRPGDRLIWIGHSAGGQIGLTMAHLGRSLDRYHDLARDTAAHRFEMVVTLGAPVGANPLPEEVKLRHYFSPQDRVVRWACLYGTFTLICLGHPVQLHEMPVPLAANMMVRIFQGVEHPCWDEERVVRRILAELRSDYRPAWQTSALPLAMGHGLSQLLCQVLEDQCRLSVEDPPE